MEDKGLIFLGIVVLALAVLAVGMIVSPENVYSSYIEKAETACSKNGGLRKIELDDFYSDVYCMDGAVYPDDIPMTGEEKQK